MLPVRSLHLVQSDGHMSKISDEVDDTAGQIKDRVGFRRDEALFLSWCIRSQF